MLPADKWFGLVEGPHLASRKPDNGITTGSIPGHASGDSNAQQSAATQTAPAPAAAPASAVAPPQVPSAPITGAPSGSANP